jgi:hypothetical protein
MPCLYDTGNTLEKALHKIDREDIVNQCVFNVELVTDDMEKAVAKVQLDQSGFDALREELGPSRDATLRRNYSSLNPNDSSFMKVRWLFRYVVNGIFVFMAWCLSLGIDKHFTLNAIFNQVFYIMAVTCRYSSDIFVNCI